jgi:GTP pyrophosphokinase
VVGFVTRGRGIVIHRRDCDNVHDSPEPERWVEIDWGPDSQNHAVLVEIEAEESSHLLQHLVKLVGSLGAKVQRSESHPDDAGQRIRLSITTRNAAQLGGVLQRLSGASGVHHARLVEN